METYDDDIDNQNHEEANKAACLESIENAIARGIPRERAERTWGYRGPLNPET